jgi:hypothetical protein
MQTIAPKTQSLDGTPQHAVSFDEPLHAAVARLTAGVSPAVGDAEPQASDRHAQGEREVRGPPDAWQRSAVHRERSWWPCWLEWLARHGSGERLAPPSTGAPAKRLRTPVPRGRHIRSGTLTTKTDKEDRDPMEVIDLGGRKGPVVGIANAQGLACPTAQHFHKAGTQLPLTPNVGTHGQEGSSFEPLRAAHGLQARPRSKETASARPLLRGRHPHR